MFEDVRVEFLERQRLGDTRPTKRPVRRSLNGLAVRFIIGKAPLSCACVFISGYPGCGKTTLANRLMGSIHRISGVRARMLEVNPVLRDIHPFVLAGYCMRYPRLFACLALLIASTRNTDKRWLVMDAVKDAIKLLCHYHMAKRQLFRSCHPRIIWLVDEPDWHKLWSILFPVHRLPSQKLLRYVIGLLRPSNHKGVTNVYIDMVVPIDVCIARFVKRENKRSRFNCSVLDNQALIGAIQQDQLYGNICDITRTFVLGNETDIRINGDPSLSVEAVAERLIGLQ